jgi:hypothetical protein
MFLAAGCGTKPDRIIFEEPSSDRITGVWSGIEEITANDDITSNIAFPGTGAGGFSFPVIIQFDGRNFTLITSGYATSSFDDRARTCSGVFTRSGTSIQFFPVQECRALPMNKFTVGRTLPNGMSLEARSNTTASALATYANVHVRFNLDRE